MSKPPPKAEEFLRAMTPEPAEPQPVAPVARSAPPPSPARPNPAPPSTASRSSLKHIGGYFDRETVEKVAVLRARLDLDNSELLKLAIDELHRKHTAKRSFGEA
jgi:hypothetical protein